MKNEIKKMERKLSVWLNIMSVILIITVGTSIPIAMAVYAEKWSAAAMSFAACILGFIADKIAMNQCIKISKELKAMRGLE